MSDDMDQVARDLNTRMGHPTADGRVTVNIVTVEDVTRPTAAELALRPCQMGMHLWAYLTVGGQECYRCGVRRR